MGLAVLAFVIIRGTHCVACVLVKSSAPRWGRLVECGLACLRGSVLEFVFFL